MYILERQMQREMGQGQFRSWRIYAFCGNRYLLDQLCIAQKEHGCCRVRQVAMTCEQLMRHDHPTAYLKAG